MFDLSWSPAEKKIAREAYEATLAAAIAKLLAEFKRRANAAACSEDLWAVEDYLRDQRKDISQMLDYRYSRLPLVLAWAIREEYIDQERLVGLSEDKLKIIHRLVAATP